MEFPRDLWLVLLQLAAAPGIIAFPSVLIDAYFNRFSAMSAWTLGAVMAFLSGAFAAVLFSNASPVAIYLVSFLFTFIAVVAMITFWFWVKRKEKEGFARRLGL